MHKNWRFRTLEVFYERYVTVVSVERGLVNLNTPNQAGSHWDAIIETRLIEFILIHMGRLLLQKFNGI